MNIIPSGALIGVGDASSLTSGVGDGTSGVFEFRHINLSLSAAGIAAIASTRTVAIAAITQKYPRVAVVVVWGFPGK